jgi:O-antigen/teichoic acid export membrane protein
MAAFVGGSMFSLAAAALMFRHLGVADTGRYTVAMSLSAVVTGLTDLGLTAIGVRELSTLRGKSRADFASNLLGIRLFLTVIGMLLVASFAFAVYGGLLGVGVLIAGGGALLVNTQSTLAVPLIARLRLGWVSALDLARYVTTAAAIALLVLVDAHLLAFLTATAVAGCVVLPVTIYLVRGDIPLRPSFDTHQWRGLVSPLLAYSAAAVTATLYLRVAIVLVSVLAGGRQLGYFSASYRVVEAFLTLPGLLVGSAFPIFTQAAREDPARLGYALSRVFEASLIIGVWISLSLLVGARVAIDVIAGTSFHPATSVLAVQGLAVAAVFVSSVWAYGLLSLHLHRVMLLTNLVMLAIMVVAVGVMAPLDGALGAAIAVVVVEVAAVFVGALALTHGRPHLRPSLRLLPKVGISALIGCSPILLTGIVVIDRLVLSSILYASALLLFGALPADLLKTVRGFRGLS